MYLLAYPAVGNPLLYLYFSLGIYLLQGRYLLTAICFLYGTSITNDTSLLRLNILITFLKKEKIVVKDFTKQIKQTKQLM